MVPIFPGTSNSTNLYCENALCGVLGSESVVGQCGMNPAEFLEGSGNSE